MIVTSRTTLIELPLPALRAIVVGDRAKASDLLDARIPNEWPGSADATAGLPIHLAALERDPQQLEWRIRLIVIARQVIGSINLKGPPDLRGDVEIGWGLVEDSRGHGYATEAARSVIDWVFANSTARRVIATIPPDHAPSQRVAARLAMQPTMEFHRELLVWAIVR